MSTCSIIKVISPQNIPTPMVMNFTVLSTNTKKKNMLTFCTKCTSRTESKPCWSLCGVATKTSCFPLSFSSDNANEYSYLRHTCLMIYHCLPVLLAVQYVLKQWSECFRNYVTCYSSDDYDWNKVSLSSEKPQYEGHR